MLTDARINAAVFSPDSTAGVAMSRCHGTTNNGKPLSEARPPGLAISHQPSSWSQQARSRLHQEASDLLYDNILRSHHPPYSVLAFSP